MKTSIAQASLHNKYCVQKARWEDHLRNIKEEEEIIINAYRQYKVFHIDKVVTLASTVLVSCRLKTYTFIPSNIVNNFNKPGLVIGVNYSFKQFINSERRKVPARVWKEISSTPVSGSDSLHQHDFNNSLIPAGNRILILLWNSPHRHRFIRKLKK